MAHIYISNELKKKLELIQQNSEIAKLLLKGDVNSEVLVEDYINYLSVDFNEPGKITYLNKERFDIIKKNGEDIWTSTKRYNSKPGGLINKIFRSISGKEVENFSALIKATFATENHAFKITEGEDIRRWYLYDSYFSVEKGSLGASCLRHPHSQPLLDLYAANPSKIKLLIMLNSGGKLVGRAIIWYLESHKIMDRIYTNNSDDEFFFKQWADNNGFLYKSKQNWNTPFIFESKGEVKKLKIQTTLPKIGFKYMPYLDTFKWMDVKTGVFYNYIPESKENLRTYTATNGSSYPANHLAMDELDEHFWQQDEIVFCDYINIKTRNINTVWSDVCEKNILAKDSIYDEDLGDYIFNKDYDFLNPVDKINSIKEQKRLILERKKLKLNQANLDRVHQLSSILMEYYRSGELNINENDFDELNRGLSFLGTSRAAFGSLGTFTTGTTNIDFGFDNYNAELTRNANPARGTTETEEVRYDEPGDPA